jgi:hypothetical protein
MRLYPASGSRRRATIAGDLALVALLVLFAWLGTRVHDTVADLASLGRGLQDAGSAVSSTARDATGAVDRGFGAAAGAVQGVPLVGARIAGALRSAGQAATQPVRRQADAEARRLVAAGREGERRALHTATLLGWLTFVIPALLLLSRFLPQRVGQVRRLSAAHTLLAGAPEDVLARRAAYGLPYATLLRHTADPFGDLAAGRHAGLLAALAEDSGVRLTARGGRA